MPTNERFIETPFGPVVGTISERLEVLGISSYLTQTGNRPNARSQWEEIVDISNVPVGTITIMTSIDKWILGYGELDPELLDPLNPNVNPGWNGVDHHIGLGRVQVTVVDINSPDLSQSPPRQSARIVIKLNFLDYNGDDRWFGMVGFSLIFLGRTPLPRPAIMVNTARHYDDKIIWHSHYPDERKEK